MASECSNDSCSRCPHFYKALKCLHKICFQCVEQHLELDNSVRCPRCSAVTPSPGPGQSQVLTLPTLRCMGGSSGSAAAAASIDAAATAADGDETMCEECETDTPATAACLDCSATLCNEHGGTHAKVKRTRGHRVVSIASGQNGRAATAADAPRSASGPQRGLNGTTRSCPLHISQRLDVYCGKCEVLACQMCVQRGAHKDHNDDLVAVEKAAAECRSRVQEQCGHAESSGHHDKISKQIETVRAGMDAIWEQSRKLSETIGERFQHKIDMLKKRQEQLVTDVDTLHLKRIQPFQVQLANLSQYLQDLVVVSEISKQCDGDCDVLRVCPWLEEKAKDIAEKAGNEEDLLDIKCEIVCGQLDECVTDGDIRKIGSVFDQNRVDPGQCVVDFPKCVLPGTAFTLTVDLRNRGGRSFPKNSPLLALTALRIVGPFPKDQPPSPDGRVANAEVPLHCDRMLNARVVPCKFDEPGRYHVTIGHDHSKTHCMFALPLAPCVFDPEHCHKDLTLSEDRHTIMCVKETGTQYSAYSKPMSSGVHHIQINYENCKIQTGCFPLAGIVAKESRPLEKQDTAGQTFTGFSSGLKPYNGKATVEHTVGTIVKWLAKVTLTLCVDCERRMFTLQCTQEAGTFQQTWKNIPKSVCVRVGLFFAGSTFTVERE